MSESTNIRLGVSYGIRQPQVKAELPGKCPEHPPASPRHGPEACGMEIIGGSAANPVMKVLSGRHAACGARQWPARPARPGHRDGAEDNFFHPRRPPIAATKSPVPPSAGPEADTC